MSAIDWCETMAFGLGVLRIAPRDFWAMSLAELNAAVAGSTGTAWSGEPLSKHDLGALMERFPDTGQQGTR